MLVSTKTDIGLQRKQNEDFVKGDVINENACYAVVCDGMGGANGGEVASKMACEFIADKINLCFRDEMTPLSVTNMLLSAITSANVSVFDASVNDVTLSGMGTTVVCAMVIGRQAIIAHVGDSRAYILSKSGIRQITKDHSLVQQMYDKGEISVEDLKNHPVKNVITRALGVEEKVEIDFYTQQLDDEETLLLCSDGLSNYVDADEIYEIVTHSEKNEVAQKLVNRANENGGGDNITVAVINL